MLQEKYEEENALAKEEADRPEKVKEMVLEAQTEAVRKEEIENLLRRLRNLSRKSQSKSKRLRSRQTL